jgi:hypothetical protein
MASYLKISFFLVAVCALATPAHAAADAQLRSRMTAIMKQVTSPAMQFAHDTNSSNDASAYRMIIGLNLASLIQKCEAGAITAAACSGYVTQMEGYVADNRLSLAEIRPWLVQIKPLVNRSGY